MLSVVGEAAFTYCAQSGTRLDDSALAAVVPGAARSMPVESEAQDWLEQFSPANPDADLPVPEGGACGTSFVLPPEAS